jgi:ABC-type dipeptide/oligopeptide/nickel transport system permease component
MRTARSKGLSEFRILMRHGVRNALIPVITIAALDIGAIIGGLIITENIFDYPGTGKYFLSAFGNGDFPLLMPLMVIIMITITTTTCTKKSDRLRLTAASWKYKLPKMESRRDGDCGLLRGKV